MEDIFVGYRYFDSFGVEPLYPFGYGLSYGKPEYELVEIETDWKEVTLRDQGKKCWYTYKITFCGAGLCECTKW